MEKATKVINVRGYRGTHPRTADHPDEAAGSLWHENGIGHIRVDTDDEAISDVYIPAADLIQFAKLYQLMGAECLVPVAVFDPLAD